MIWWKHFMFTWFCGFGCRRWCRRGCQRIRARTALFQFCQVMFPDARFHIISAIKSLIQAVRAAAYRFPANSVNHIDFVFFLVIISVLFVVQTSKMKTKWRDYRDWKSIHTISGVAKSTFGALGSCKTVRGLILPCFSHEVCQFIACLNILYWCWQKNTEQVLKIISNRYIFSNRLEKCHIFIPALTMRTNFYRY